ncbi:transposase (fragment) [Nitrosomonas mobilis]|uniref:Mutator family transposase n=1 Tax=Nitrosomonas mobilis TaxID=51642 RepID=A0A1G5SGU8_9PROT
MVRNSLNYVGWNKRKEVAADLRLIYSAATIDEAEQALADFEDKWNKPYPPIALSWRNNWQRIIYTTNTIESVNMSLRKVSKIRGSFPNDDAVIKLFYLALSNIVKRWSRSIRNWKPALNRFTIQFNERTPRQY